MRFAKTIASPCGVRGCFHLLAWLVLSNPSAAVGAAPSAPQNGNSGPSVAQTLPSDIDAAQRQIEEQYIRSHDRQLLLKLAELAKAQKREWLAASLYLNHQRAADSVPDAPSQNQTPSISFDPQHAVRVFVFYQNQPSTASTLRVNGRVVGPLPQDGWILVPIGAIELSVHSRGAVRVFHPEPLSAGQAPRTIVLTDYGPPIVSTGVTVAIDGQAVAPSASVPALQAALVAGVEANLVVALPVAAGDALVRTATQSDCGTGSGCERTPSASAGFRYLLRAKIQQQPGRHSAELAVFNLDASQRAAFAVWECRDCDDGSLRAKLQAKVKELMGQALNQQTVALRIESQPSGAQVLLNGELRGVTPLRTQILEGPQRFRVRKEGFLKTEQEHTLSEAFAAAHGGVLSFQLAPDRLAIRARRLSIAKWTMLGIGLAATVASGTLLALDGFQTCGDAALVESKTCPYLLSTQPGSYVGLAFSGAALLSFPVLWGVESKTRKLMQDRE